MYFRTKTIKGTPLVQLVESYRNAEGSPGQRVVASPGDAEVPEAEKTRVYKILGNDWKRACPAVKSELKDAAIS